MSEAELKMNVAAQCTRYHRLRRSLTWGAYGILLALSLLCATASGGLIRKVPVTRKTESPNGRFVFVVVSPDALEQELAALDRVVWDSDAELLKIKDEVRQIRSQFTTTGMYRNDGSASPIWTVQEIFPFVHVADDGKHLVVVEAWVVGDAFGSKLARFITEGRTVRQHDIIELIPLYFIRQLLVRDIIWCTYEEFDPAKATYTVRSDQGDIIIFDAVSGDVLSSNASRITFQILFTSVPFLVTVGLLFACMVAYVVGTQRNKGISRKQGDAGAEPADR